MVIEMDYRDYKKALQTRRMVLSVLTALSILPLLFDPITLNFTLLALSVNAIVWMSWLLDTVGRLRETALEHDRRDRADTSD
jgi:hypothetical protein